MFAYDQVNPAEVEAALAPATGSSCERLGAALHAALEAIRPHRRMLAASTAAGRPGGPLSVQLALRLYVQAEMPTQACTHQRVDDALELRVPMLPLLATAIGRSVTDGIGCPVAGPDCARLVIPHA